MKSSQFAFCLSLFLLNLHHVGAGTLAQFRTIFGNLEVELYDQQKPVTVQNFKRLVQSGAYQDTFFHRVQPGFVAQGGGYFTLIPFSTNAFAPPWSYLGLVTNFGAISNEFNVGPRLSNTNGTLAMVKAEGNPNSATSQWFFNLGNNSANLDNQNGGFTVFGHVVRDTGPTNLGGMLGLFNTISYFDGLLNMQYWHGTNDPVAKLFQALPVTYSGSFYPWYSDLFYVDISLLSVQIAMKTNGTCEISWNSIADKMNYVEFTTNFPPVWTQLVSTNGNGRNLKAVDTSPGSGRFYRVRIAY
jgi:cyclophilin family peptidyl-prolyl cis-trans isomerase